MSAASKVLFLVLFTFLSFATIGQKTFKAKGSAFVQMEKDMSKDEARQLAKDQAIISAIEEVFGSYIEQESRIKVEDGETTFRLVGTSKVKGEWLKTEKEDYDEELRETKGEYGKENEIWISCQITGIVREIVKPRLAFEIQPLNCPQKICRTEKYLNDEPFYMYFRSPSAGYISVYIVEGQEVYRLLPYQEMVAPYSDAVPVSADQEYVFFSQDMDYFDDFAPERIDQLEMFTDKESEYMELYVVFSTEPFSKPVLNAGKVIENGSLPKSLSLRKFEEWISNNRIFNGNFNYEQMTVEIVQD